jgi:murein DD-endopeptidase MepM/ murein hydrolase activator NlpD
MRNRIRSLWLGLALACALPAFLLYGAASAPRHAHSHKSGHRSHGKRVLSAQEARLASVRKAQLRRRLHGLSSHIHQVRTRIHEARAKESSLSDNLQTIQTRLEATRHSLARVDARLELLSAQHEQTVRRLQETQARLALRRRLLGARIRYNYERSQATYASVLLASSSLHDLLSRSYYVHQIVQSETELIQGVRQDVRAIEADKRQLEAQTQEQQRVAAEFDAQKVQYAADQEREQTLLHNVQATRAQAEEELDELESESEAMTDRIRALSEALRQRRLAQQEPHGGRRGHSVPESAESPVWHGGFIRPCEARITSGFGYRYHPILHRRKLHTGVDFGASYGTPIHAAAGGTVIQACYTRGYGNCVIIDHGNGVTTLYGHCSELLVSQWQTVSQGQEIARVGSTGMSTGPHLHFEVRHNGVPVRPF